MSDLRSVPARGSEKVIEHYRLQSERELYRSRIEREQRLLDELQGRSGASPPSGWRSLPATANAAKVCYKNRY